MPRSRQVARSSSKPSSQARRPPQQPHEDAGGSREVPADVEAPRLTGAHAGELGRQRLHRRPQGQDLGVDVGEVPDHGAVLPIRSARPPGLELGRVVEAAVVAVRARRRLVPEAAAGPVPVPAERSRHLDARVVAQTVEAGGGGEELLSAGPDPGIARGPDAVNGPEDGGDRRRHVAPQQPLADPRRGPDGGDERRQVLVDHHAGDLGRPHRPARGVEDRQLGRAVAGDADCRDGRRGGRGPAAPARRRPRRCSAPGRRRPGRTARRPPGGRPCPARRRWRRSRRRRRSGSARRSAHTIQPSSLGADGLHRR